MKENITLSLGKEAVSCLVLRAVLLISGPQSSTRTYRTPEFKYISLTVILRMMGRESQGKAVLRNPVQGLNSETRKL